MNIQPYPNSLAVPAVNIRLFSELFFHNTRHGKARSERFTAAPGRACAFGAKLRACPHRRTYSSRPPRQYKKGTRPMLCSLFGCPWQIRKERSDGIAHRSPLYKEAARSRHCRRAKRSICLCCPLAGLAPSAQSSAGARFAHAHIAELTVLVRRGNTKREHSQCCVPFLAAPGRLVRSAATE